MHFILSCLHFINAFYTCHPAGDYVHIGYRSMNISHLEIVEKPGIFCLTYQLHSSSADCARKLFKPWKDSTSLRMSNEKNVCFGFRLLCEWHHK